MSRSIAVFVLGLVILGASAASQALELTGPLSQGALVRGQVAPGSEVRLNGDPVRVTDDGRFVLGFDRNAELRQQLTVLAPDGSRRQKTLTLAERDYRVQRIDGVPGRTVTPSEEHLARIRQEASQVREVRDTDSSLTGFLGDFIWPASGRITGVYGSQRIYNGEPRSPHYGIDIAAPAGAPVVAPADGVVTLAEPDLFYSGGTLIIDHGFGVSSTFLHLSGFEVTVGQRVRQGDRVARVGSSGRSTGPHLDWRMNWYQVRVDPNTVAPAPTAGHTP
ncbi:MAG: M23 family metallopeptidase [Marinobacter sp.]|uniref:M23 family metallopeptidase n=1 Tax=Marinobacter sp. TaxID=50741 RepID=UPI00299D2A58|nr:M23 family metallopeptidase [Marinobacter sp.]MDX1633796.1 M23 family metallopeptidase [Marinobacter sp.]